MPRTTRILLVDDHSLMRAGIRALFDATDDLRVVAEAVDGREALAMVREHAPDVVLLDISLPGLNGIEVAEMMRQECLGPGILMLSQHTDKEYVLRALKAGASGYVLKDCTPSELREAVRTVASGRVFLTPDASKYLVDVYRSPDSSDDASPVERLTPRQRQVLQLIAKGLTSREIGETLSISPKTVESHRQQLMETLGIHDIAGLVRLALRTGLVAAE